MLALRFWKIKVCGIYMTFIPGIDNFLFRVWMNFIAAGFVTVGVLFDAGVWYYVKDLKIFDDEVKNKELQMADKEDEIQMEKPQS